MTAEHSQLKPEYLSFRRTLNGEELITPATARASREKWLPSHAADHHFYPTFFPPGAPSAMENRELSRPSRGSFNAPPSATTDSVSFDLTDPLGSLVFERFIVGGSFLFS